MMIEFATEDEDLAAAKQHRLEVQEDWIHRERTKKGEWERELLALLAGKYEWTSEILWEAELMALLDAQPEGYMPAPEELLRRAPGG